MLQVQKPLFSSSESGSHATHCSPKAAIRCICKSFPTTSVELEKWQHAKLREAAAVGRKKVEIRTLCKETGLDRRSVLGWLKALERSTEEVLDGRQEVEQTRDLDRYSATSSAIPAAEDLTEGREQLKPSRRFSRAAEATLEMVFSEAPRPHDQLIDSITELHHLPRRQVLDWFAERRGSKQKPKRIRRAVRSKRKQAL